MYQSSRILGDIEPEAKKDRERISGSAGSWDSMHSSGPTATEIPLTHDEPAEPRFKSPRRTNGGASGRNLRTDWAEAPPISVPRERKRRGSTVAGLFLLLAFAVLAWYFYPQLMTSYQYISHLPATEEAMKGLEARANSTETQLRSLTDNWGSLDQQASIRGSGSRRCSNPTRGRN